MPVEASSALPSLDRTHALHLLREMLRVRRFEEKCAELYSAAKIRGFLHLYIGEEAVAVGAIQALTPDDAIVGGGLPIAVGLALADKLQGRSRVNACFFGEGAVAEGEFHESMNLAALWKLPVLFCCENNLYAMGTALKRSESETDLCLKASSYEIAAWPVDGMDVVACEEAAHRAALEVRSGGGPCFLEFRTYRFRAHSMYDPQLYREKREVEEWKLRDQITLFETRLREQSLINDDDVKQIEE